MKKNIHPKTKDYFRTFLAKRNIFLLILIYVLLVAFVSMIIGFLLWFFETKPSSYSLWCLFTFLQLFDAELPGLQVDLNTNQSILFIVVVILKVVLPTFLLGILVFKLFIRPNVFIFRKNTSIYFNKNLKKNILVIKFYSATKLNIVNVNYNVVARIPFVSDITGTNSRKYQSLELEKNYWPIATTHIPFTIHIPLDDSDIKQKKKSSKLRSIQKNKFEKGFSLIVLVTAQVPELGTEVIETHLYRIPEQLEWGIPGNLDIDFFDTLKSKNWKWYNFE